jgi:DNA-binding response OmpR family regulator
MGAVAVVADDDDAICDLLTAVLADEGYAVVSLTDCASVVGTLTTLKASVLLLDLRFAASLCGLDVLRQIATLDELRALRVLVCSAAAEVLQEHAVWLRERGYDTLIKPFYLHDLRAWLAQHARASL